MSGMKVDTPDGGRVRLRADGDRLRIIVEEGGHSGMSASVELSPANIITLVAALPFFEEEVGS